MYINWFTLQTCLYKAESVTGSGEIAMKNDIDRTIRQVSRSLYEDGLIEIGLGLLFLAVTGGAAALALARSDAGLAAGIAVALLLLVIAGALAFNWLLNAAKSRWVYPRTGYAAYRSDTGSAWRWLIAGLAFALAILLPILLPEWARTISLTYGLLLAAVAVAIGVQTGLRRLYGIATASAALGLITTLARLETVADGLVMLSGTGLILLAAGGLALRVYLARHPRPAGEGD
jgi:hypothetical protein